MNKIEEASGVAPANIGSGNEKAAHFDTVGDTTNAVGLNKNLEK